MYINYVGMHLTRFISRWPCRNVKKETGGGDGTTLNALIIDSIVILNVLNICISQFCENFMKKRH